MKTPTRKTYMILATVIVCAVAATFFTAYEAGAVSARSHYRFQENRYGVT